MPKTPPSAAPTSTPPTTNWKTPARLAILTACASLASGCALFRTPRNTSVTVLGDGTRNWYPPGEAVALPASANTNGLWVLTPAMLKHIILSSLEPQ